MVVTCMPMTAHSEPVNEDVDAGAVHDSASGAGGSATTEEYAGFIKILRDGVECYSLELYEYEKIEITAEKISADAKYQWQILHPEKNNLWINIYDAKEVTLPLTAALLKNMLRDDGTAQVRCRADVGEDAYVTPAFTVTLLNGEETVYTGEDSAEFYAADGDDDDEIPEFVTVTIEYTLYSYQESDISDELVITNMGDAFTPYIATLKSGQTGDINKSVHTPTIMGYEAWLTDEDGNKLGEEAIDSVLLQYNDLVENKVVYVGYFPAKVKYEVRYYFQNIYDDLYTEDTSKKLSGDDIKAETGTRPPTEQVNPTNFVGFTPLFYQPETVAADGSTIFEVYLERDYYLMEFDCNGGYGVETLYVRYETYISVADPIRHGYIFSGWDLVKTEQVDTTENPIPPLGTGPDSNGFYTGDGYENVPPTSMPHYNTAYKALWETTTTTYTVVYWRENADDDGYSYWDSKQIGINANGTYDGTVHSNDHVSGTDHTTATGLSEAAYFTYNAVKTEYEESKRTDLASDRKVIVEGDGSTVVNVYYSRNVYTLQFNIGNATFTPPAASHVHTDGNCSYKLICGIQDHIHSAECISTLTCTIPEHAAHTAECLTCVLTEHTHGISCTLCDQDGHQHTEACCALDEHVHDITCYGPNAGYTEGISSSSGTTNNAIAAITNPQVGYIYRYNRNDTYHNFFYTHTGWYYLGTDTQYRGLLNGTISNPSRGAYTVSNLPAILECGKVEHSHEEGGCDYSDCTLHVHTEACYVCGKMAHTHSAACCTKDVHTADEHTIICYQGVETPNNNVGNNAPNNPSEGQVYRRNNGTYYIYINGQWYTYTGSTTSGNIAPTICHVHGDGSCTYCALSEHDHTDTCLDCGLTEHLHGDACYKDAIHAHSDACYTWTCGASAHIHTDECYSSCIKPESYVSGTGSSTRFYIKAKYNQTIGDIWPTSAHYPGLYGWSVEGNTSTTAVSKKINMTSDLCDTTDGVRVVNAVTQNTNYTVHLYYMFESFDQSSPENGNERKLYNGVYYDKSELYYQENVAAGSSKFSQKDITGMTAVDVVSQQVQGSEYNNFLYYKRERVDFKFHNVNTTVQTITDLMYEYPLKDLTVDGKPASAYVPPYPTTYEPGAYEFGGWYTTPQCFTGTEVDWKNGTMPITDFEIYAKWTPVIRNVYFYYLYTDMDINDPSDDKGDPWKPQEDPDTITLPNDVTEPPVMTYPIEVEHGALVGTAYSHTPKRNGYQFVGWFYMDENNKKKFAPDSMEITKDLYLFAEWLSEIDTEYTVNYVYMGAGITSESENTDKSDDVVIANPTTGHSTAGRTKTFDAKGLTDLYDFSDEGGINYQLKYFPTVNSHSILISTKDPESDVDPNEYTFYYVYSEGIWYKVRYVDYTTGLEIGETKTVFTPNAIVTEKFKPIAGYRPYNNTYYITKSIQYQPDSTETNVIDANIITFYYVKDLEHGPYIVEHYQEDAYVDNKYNYYEAEKGIDDLLVDGVTNYKSATPKTYDGFEFSYATVVWYDVTIVNGAITKTEEKGFKIAYENGSYKKYEATAFDAGKPSDFATTGSNASLADIKGALSVAGVEIRLYYNRLYYGYTVQYLVYGTNAVLEIADTRESTTDIGAEIPVAGGNTTLPAAKFDREVSFTAPNIYEEDGVEYTITGAAEKSIIIRIDEASNVLTFYYLPKQYQVHYVAVCSIGKVADFGNVSPSGELLPNNYAGSTATAGEGFEFIGWYLDAECETTVNSVPGVVEVLEDGLFVPLDSYVHANAAPNATTGFDEITFYALFEPITTSMTITKEINTPSAESSAENFIFHVIGHGKFEYIDLYVSRTGAGSIKINELPIGEYTVEEITAWSWEYGNVTYKVGDGAATSGSVISEINVTTSGVTVTFTNTSAPSNWLESETVADNKFGSYTPAS